MAVNLASQFWQAPDQVAQALLLDSGLLCHLMRIASPHDLYHHAMRGPGIETWVVIETLKHRFKRGLTADLYLWCDTHGQEVDRVFQQGQQVQAVECKSGVAYSADWMGPARRWCKAVGPAAKPPVVVNGGASSHARSDHRVLSWQDPGLAGA